MRSYSLDPRAASDVGTSNFITDTGKYVGRFVRAEAKISKQQTDGIELDFVADDGRRANFLSLWTYTRDGQETYGLKVLSAILACLRLRGIQGGQIHFKDRDGRPVTGDGFPDLMGKPIGLLLQRANFTKDDGSPGYKFNIFAPFDAKSELTASEILNKAQKPEQLAGMVARLTDRAPRNATQAGGHSGARDYATASGGREPGSDDDISW